MNLVRSVFLTVLVPVLVSACRSTPTASPSAASDVAAIRALDEWFATRMQRREVRALVESYYTADARLMGPGEPTAVGRAAIEAALNAFPPITDFALDSSDVVVRGDLAYACGTYSMTLTPPGAAPIRDTGKYLEILRRQPDGSWKVSRDMYSSDLPAPSAAVSKP